jgi:hypothetical protein
LYVFGSVPGVSGSPRRLGLSFAVFLSFCRLGDIVESVLDFVSFSNTKLLSICSRTIQRAYVIALNVYEKRGLS